MHSVAPASWTVGEHLGTSEWLAISQERITAFGQITDDLEPLHTDPAWCREHSPVGQPIAYGFLTLSLLTRFMHEITKGSLTGTTDRPGYALNYGFDRVRFVSVVPVDSRIRCHVTFAERRMRADGDLMRFSVVVECEGASRPALTAEWWSLWVVGT